MKQNASWKVKSCIAHLEIFHTLWNMKFHCHAHNNLSLVPILSQSTHTHKCKFHFNIIFTHMASFLSGLFLSAFLLNSVCISHVYHICQMPFHCIYTDMFTLTLFGRDSTNFDVLLSTSVTSLQLPSLFGLHILLIRHRHFVFTQ